MCVFAASVFSPQKTTPTPATVCAPRCCLAKGLVPAQAACMCTISVWYFYLYPRCSSAVPRWCTDRMRSSSANCEKKMQLYFCTRYLSTYSTMTAQNLRAIPTCSCPVFQVISCVFVSFNFALYCVCVCVCVCVFSANFGLIYLSKKALTFDLLICSSVKQGHLRSG